MNFVIKTVGNKTPQIQKSSYISDGVFISGDVRLKNNVNIWPNCSIRGDLASVIIGENTNIQDNTVIHTSPYENENYKINQKGHVVIGKNTTIGHLCVIHSCKIGDNCLIGMGSIVGDEAVIENNSFVGASSNVVPKTIVKTGELWLGNPAKFFRKLKDSDIEYMKKDIEIYNKLSKEYSKN